MSRQALITGCLGGIGRALVQAFAEAGYTVIGMDLADAATGHGPLPQHYISADLGKLCTDTAYRDTTLQAVKALLPRTPCGKTSLAASTTSSWASS